MMVNHSIEFVDAIGAQTNHMESTWRAVKSTMTTAVRKKAHGEFSKIYVRTKEFYRHADKFYRSGRAPPNIAHSTKKMKMMKKMATFECSRTNGRTRAIEN